MITEISFFKVECRSDESGGRARNTALLFASRIAPVLAAGNARQLMRFCAEWQQNDALLIGK